MNIRVAGFGGQGIVMAGYLLGHAGIMDGGCALQNQSYGSESRGGASKSDVIISDSEILELAPTELDVLIAMAQPALDKHLPILKNGGILIYDSGLVKPKECTAQAIGLPATETAKNRFGSDMVANVIMLGCLAGLTAVVSRESLRKVIAETVPPKTKDKNLDAFEEGFKTGVEMKEAEGSP